LSLIRKVFWPAIIAFGVLAVMAAMGGSNGTRVASADSNDFCAIEGPKVITVGKTYLYLARLDHWDDDVTVEASIDNIIGNSKITSFVDGDFNFGDYKKVGPTNVVHDLDIEDIFNIDDDLLDFFADPAGFNTPIAAISTSCENITDTLTTMIEEAIDRGNACNFFVTATSTGITSGDCLVRSTTASTYTFEQLYNDGVTSGCATSPLRFCPGDPVTRAQMAVFLLRAEHGSSYTPPPATGIFSDVAADFTRPFIEQLYNEAVTSGCATSPLRYCPTDAVSRGQMAVFLLRTFSLPPQEIGP